jgi:hypothetical protein
MTVPACYMNDKLRFLKDNIFIEIQETEMNYLRRFNDHTSSQNVKNEGMPKKKVNGRIYGYRETCFERLI